MEETTKKEDVIFGFLCLVLGYFFIRNTIFCVQFDQKIDYNYYSSLLRFSSGLGMFIFTSVFVLAVNLFAKKKGIKSTKEANFWMILLLLQGVGFLLFSRPSLNLITFVGLFFTAIYWVLVRLHYLTVQQTSDYVIYDLLRGIFMYPFVSFFSLKKILLVSMKQKRFGKKVLQILIGLLIGVPITLLFYELLCQIDQRFQVVISISSIMNQLFDGKVKYLFCFMLGVPVAFYIFGLIYGLATQKKETTNKESVVEVTGRFGFMSMTTITTILTMVVILYILFFSVQAGYLFSAFENILPSNYTYAEYARRGFFELCAICVLNLLLLFFAHIICEGANRKVLKIFTLTIYSFNAMFVVIAFRKMILYITTYGLTQKRMLTCWFMVFIAVVIMIGVLREFFHFAMLRYVAFAVAILFTICCLSNMDEIIARNNAWLYENGKMTSPDYVTLVDCGAAALPTIYELIEQEENPEVLEKLQLVLQMIDDNYYEDKSWYEIVVQNELVKE